MRQGELEVIGFYRSVGGPRGEGPWSRLFERIRQTLRIHH